MGGNTVKTKIEDEQKVEPPPMIEAISNVPSNNDPIKGFANCPTHSLNMDIFCIQEGQFVCEECQSSKHEGHSQLTPNEAILSAAKYSQLELLESQRNTQISIKKEQQKSIENIDLELKPINSRILSLIKEFEEKGWPQEQWQNIIIGVPQTTLDEQNKLIIQQIFDEYTSLNEKLNSSQEEQMNIIKKECEKLSSISTAENFYSNKDNGLILHQAERGSNQLYLFDPRQERIQKKIMLKNGKFFNCCETGSSCNKIFAFGGIDEGGIYRNNIQEIDMRKKLFIGKQAMKTGKQGFGIANNPQNSEFYIIGGITLDGFLNECNSYDCSIDVWGKLPTLPIAIGWVGVTVKTNFLQTVGGSSTSSYLSSIYKLDLEGRNEWINLKIPDLISIFPRRNSPCVNTISDSTVIIFGGYNSGGNSNETQELKSINESNIVSWEIEKGIQLPMNTRFYNSSHSFLIESKVFAFDYQGNLLIYSINEIKWRIMKKNVWRI